NFQSANAPFYSFNTQRVDLVIALSPRLSIGIDINCTCERENHTVHGCEIGDSLQQKRGDIMNWRWVYAVVLSTLVFTSVSVGAQAGSSLVTDREKNAPAQKETSQNRDTLWVIPHTHWEGAVFKTREEYLEGGLPHILTVLRLLKTHPDYRFVLDQMAYVKPFLERYPEEEAAFRRFVAERKLELVGG